METEGQILDQYIRTGKARLVYRHLMQLGDGSRVLAEVSECAGVQGRFWEMRELLYRRQDELYGVTDFAGVQPLVAELRLDERQFQQCLTTGQFRQQVDADYAAAQREGIVGRPVTDINGTRIIGSQRFEQYQKVLDAVR